jgi:hypothetical protein
MAAFGTVMTAVAISTRNQTVPNGSRRSPEIDGAMCDRFDHYDG